MSINCINDRMSLLRNLYINNNFERFGFWFKETHHHQSYHVLIMSELSGNGDKCQLSLQTNTALAFIFYFKSGPFYLGFGFDIVSKHKEVCTIGRI